MSRRNRNNPEVEEQTEPGEGDNPDITPVLTAQECVDKMDNMRKIYPVLNGDLYEIARYVKSVDPSVVIPGHEDEVPPVTATLGGKPVDQDGNVIVEQKEEATE